MKTLSALLVVCFLFAFHKSLAHSKSLIYGPEWTFSVPNLSINFSLSFDRDTQMRVADNLDKYCKTVPGCEVKENHRDGVFAEIQYQDKVKLYMSLDPSVFEVGADPLSLQEWKDHQKITQEILFDQMKTSGFIPHEIMGAGHVNIGLEYFQDKPLLFRNFIVDTYNNTGVGTVLNSLADNARYARYMHDMGEHPEYRFLQKRFKKGLEQLDALPEYDSVKVMDLIGRWLGMKYIALGIRSGKVIGVNEQELAKSDVSLFEFSGKGRFEIRVLRPQATMQEYIKVLEIFENRIRYLETFKQPIEFKPSKSYTDGWKALGEFKTYLKESGLEWEDYKSLAPTVWRDLSVENFKSPKKTYQPLHSCQQLLKPQHP